MTEDHLSALPLFVTIALTGSVLASVIAWQATGGPIVALLLGPWLLVMVAMALPRSSAIGHDVPTPAPVRRRAVAAGMATAAVVAALSTAGNWSDDLDADPAATMVLAVAVEESFATIPICDAVTYATDDMHDQ